MTTAIDRRMVRRRLAVTEHSARRRLGLLLLVIVLVGAGGLAGWLLYHSPYLDLREVTIGGQVESRADEILDDLGVTAGTPTIKVHAGLIEAALLADPWIAAADVRVTWPGTVTVDVLEYVPVAWVETTTGWVLATEGGRVLVGAVTPGDDYPLVSVGSVPAVPGTALDETAWAGIAFIEALPASLSRGAVLRGDGGELHAVVGGHEVLLGYPEDVTEKAEALIALLAVGVPEHATINLVSPSRPAVIPQPLVETPEEVIVEPRPTG